MGVVVDCAVKTQTYWPSGTKIPFGSRASQVSVILSRPGRAPKKVITGEAAAPVGVTTPAWPGTSGAGGLPALVHDPGGLWFGHGGQKSWPENAPVPTVLTTTDPG